MIDPKIENEKREKAKEIDLKESEIREFRVVQRLRWVWLSASLAVTVLLGWATLVSIRQSYPGWFGYIGLLAGLMSTAYAAIHILRRRPQLPEMRYDLLVLESDRTALEARSAADHMSALRIYRIGSQEDVENYRTQAARNRRVHNFFQGVIIVGSIAVTSLTSAGIASNWTRWGGAAIAGLVSVSAGFTGYFKYRERSFNQQQTADAIEKEFRAVELRLQDYDASEEEALKHFAQKVEDLKEEQRKRELQLEQSSSQQDQHRA